MESSSSQGLCPEGLISCGQSRAGPDQAGGRGPVFPHQVHKEIHSARNKLWLLSFPLEEASPRQVPAERAGRGHLPSCGWLVCFHLSLISCSLVCVSAPRQPLQQFHLLPAPTARTGQGVCSGSESSLEPLRHAGSSLSCACLPQKASTTRSPTSVPEEGTVTSGRMLLNPIQYEQPTCLSKAYQENSRTSRCFHQQETSCQCHF